MRKSICKEHKKWDYFSYIFGCLTIFAFNVRNLHILTTPNILFDEFGYLATGAFFANRDWSDIVSNFVSYYSYGYGFIISLVMRCTSTTALAYQVLIICNAVMVCAMFILSDYVCKDFIGNVKLRKIICFGACFYPSIIHNTQFAWTETLLALLFLVILSVLKSLIYKPSIIKSGFLGVLAVYIYTVHQRSIGVLGATVLIMLITTGTKITNKKCLISFFVVLAAAVLIHCGIKGYIQKSLWTVNDITEQEIIAGESEEEHEDHLSANDYGGQVKKIAYIFTVDGFSCFLMGILGKVYYFGIATFFLGFEGIYCVVNLLIRGIKNYREHRENLDKKSYITLFALLSFVATMLVAAIFHIYPTRIDTIMYGRYTDWMVIFFVILGVSHICAKGFPIKRLCYYIGTSLVFLCLFNMFIKKYNLWSNFATCSPITFFFRNDLCGCEVKWVTLMFLMMITFSILILILLSRAEKKSSVAGIIIMVLIWIKITMPAIDYDIMMGRQKELTEVVNVINKERRDDAIYYVMGDNYPSLHIGGLQYLLNDRSIQVITEDGLRAISEGIVIFEKESPYTSSLSELYIKLDENELFDIYCFAQ